MSGTFPPTLPTTAQLIANWTQQLADAEAARHKLLIQQLPSVVLYNVGEGSRQVSYTRTTVAALNEYIADLERKLGRRRRRAIGVRF